MRCAGREFDVTRAVVVASLRPLTLGVGSSDEPVRSALAQDSRPELRLIDLDSGSTVGVLQLQAARTWETAGARLSLFHILLGTQRCVRWPYRAWNQWLQNRQMRRNTDPHNFSMAPQAVQQQMIFYICPRPVVLVSVDDGQHSNLFPMDLIGPISDSHFTLALRSTSQSVPAMKNIRRVALCDVPARDYALAYKLGAHHKNVQVSWDTLPFQTHRSRLFKLRCPEIALRVREIEILDFDTIGSHTLFMTQVVSEQTSRNDPQFFHTSGIYQHFRSRHGRPFPTAAQEATRL